MRAWTGVATDADAVEELARRLLAELPTARPTTIVIEGIADFLSGTADLALQDLLKAATLKLSAEDTALLDKASAP